MDAPFAPTSGTIRDLADLLAQTGPVVAGGAALFGTLGFLAAQVSRDLGARDVDPVEWAEMGARWGAVLGLVALGYRWGGVD